MPNTTGPSQVSSATPKPRAGEHTGSRTPLVGAIVKKFPHSAQLEELARNLEAERDLLRERERELVEALGWVVKSAPNTVDMRRLLEFSGLDDVIALQRKLDHWDYQLEQARALLAKHGR